MFRSLVGTHRWRLTGRGRERQHCSDEASQEVLLRQAGQLSDEGGRRRRTAPLQAVLCDAKRPRCRVHAGQLQ